MENDQKSYLWNKLVAHSGKVGGICGIADGVYNRSELEVGASIGLYSLSQGFSLLVERVNLFQANGGDLSEVFVLKVRVR